MRVHAVIASLLALVLMAVVAVPATAAPTRAKTAEKTVHDMVNCLRTGGKIKLNGVCKDRNSGKHSKYVAPLNRSSRISNKVAWPWARKSVQFYGRNTCWIGHSRNGSTVDSRFRAASLSVATIANGENMGCGLYTGAKKDAIVIVRMWQREKNYGGPHWRQLKAKRFKSAGYGVANYGARKTQILVNFYGKSVD